MSLFKKIMDKFGDAICVSLDVIGVASASLVASPLPIPAWGKMVLRVVSVVASTLGVALSVYQCVKNVKDCTKPNNLAEKILSGNNKVDDDNYSEVDAEYEDLRSSVADEIRTGKKQSRKSDRKRKFDSVNPAVNKYKNRPGKNAHVKSEMNINFDDLSTCDDVANLNRRNRHTAGFQC